ncbi:MAG: STAS domain-containing protein [Verrucomicrobiales bacterium]
MELQKQTHESADVLVVRGKLDSTNASDFDGKLRELIADDTKPMVLDFSAVITLTSAPLRALLTLAKRLQRHGLPLLIAAPSENALESLRISGFLKLKLFEVVDSVEAALGVAAIANAKRKAAPSPVEGGAANKPSPTAAAPPEAGGSEKRQEKRGGGLLGQGWGIKPVGSAAAAGPAKPGPAAASAPAAARVEPSPPVAPSSPVVQPSAPGAAADALPVAKTPTEHAARNPPIKDGAATASDAIQPANGPVLPPLPPLPAGVGAGLPTAAAKSLGAGPAKPEAAVPLGPSASPPPLPPVSKEEPPAASAPKPSPDLPRVSLPASTEKPSEPAAGRSVAMPSASNTLPKTPGGVQVSARPNAVAGAPSAAPPVAKAPATAPPEPQPKTTLPPSRDPPTSPPEGAGTSIGEQLKQAVDYWKARFGTADSTAKLSSKPQSSGSTTTASRNQTESSRLGGQLREALDYWLGRFRK